MSVDTYLRGKRVFGRYDSFDVGGVRVLVAKTLSNWAQAAALDMRGVPVFRRLKPVVEHQHTDDGRDGYEEYECQHPNPLPAPARLRLSSAATARQRFVGARKSIASPTA